MSEPASEINLIFVTKVWVVSVSRQDKQHGHRMKDGALEAHFQTSPTNAARYQQLQIGSTFCKTIILFSTLCIFNPGNKQMKCQVLSEAKRLSLTTASLEFSELPGPAGFFFKWRRHSPSGVPEPTCEEYFCTFNSDIH